MCSVEGNGVTILGAPWWNSAGEKPPLTALNCFNYLSTLFTATTAKIFEWILAEIATVEKVGPPLNATTSSL